MNLDRLFLWKVLKGVLLVSWLTLSFISLNHLYPVVPFFSKLSTDCIGRAGWGIAFLSIIFFSRGFIRSLLVLVVVFFTLGFVIGPFLEPPADPLGHLRRVHELNCGKTLEQVPRQNRGLWQYSMIGVLLCTNGEKIQPDRILRNIDITNGLFWALLAAVLYILAISAGLPRKWAFLSVLICFLFFGTNRFSYFRYYSLAPSFTSMMIYWLWVAGFYFRKKFREVVSGLVVALLSIPIIWVNHKQEAVFLGFTVLVWIIVNIAFTWGRKSFLPGRKHERQHWILEKLFTVNGAVFLILFITCWLLPQFVFFRQWLSRFFIREMGMQYQSVAVYWHGLYLGGRISGLRIMDTFGGMGILMLLLTLPYFLLDFFKGTFERKTRIIILATLPFMGYFIPLFHFIWSSNVIRPEYYRLCYMSMFWLFFADLLWSVEQSICTSDSGVHCLRKNDKM